MFSSAEQVGVSKDNNTGYATEFTSRENTKGWQVLRYYFGVQQYVGATNMQRLVQIYYSFIPVSWGSGGQLERLNLSTTLPRTLPVLTPKTTSLRSQPVSERTCLQSCTLCSELVGHLLDWPRSVTKGAMCWIRSWFERRLYFERVRGYKVKKTTKKKLLIARKLDILLLEHVQDHPVLRKEPCQKRQRDPRSIESSIGQI